MLLSYVIITDCLYRRWIRHVRCHRICRVRTQRVVLCGSYCTRSTQYNPSAFMVPAVVPVVELDSNGVLTPSNVRLLRSHFLTMQNLSYLPYWHGLLSYSWVKVGYACTAMGALPAILGIATGTRPSVYVILEVCLWVFGTRTSVVGFSKGQRQWVAWVVYSYRRSNTSIYPCGSFTPTSRDSPDNSTIEHASGGATRVHCPALRADAVLSLIVLSSASNTIALTSNAGRNQPSCSSPVVPTPSSHLAGLALAHLEAAKPLRFSSPI